MTTDAEFLAEHRRLENEAIAAMGTHHVDFEKQAQILVQGMQSTQRNLLATFEQFLAASKKMAEDLMGK